jgi:hypothetical protein
MERVGKKAMKGALLFAFNTELVDYVKMAVFTAKRINRFLNLPVTIVTDSNANLSKYDYTFDNVILAEANTDNNRNNSVWLNKGRFKAFDYTPYYETLVLDVDYIVNSDRLLKTFDIYEDFMCHKNIHFLMQPEVPQEKISNLGIDSVWATTMTFKKNKTCEHIFQCMKMVQENYDHYINLYYMTIPYFRNDYSLAISLKILNGQLDNNRYYTPWHLLHTGPGTKVYKEKDTQYTIVYDNWINGKIRKDYITVKDTDFHMIVKDNFMEVIDA